MIVPNSQPKSQCKKNLESQVQSIYLGYSNPNGTLGTIRVNPDYFLNHVSSNGYLIDSKHYNKDFSQTAVSTTSSSIMLKPESTFRYLSWMKHPSYLVMCEALDGHTKKPVSYCPRNQLKHQVALLSQDGYSAVAASELEYFFFNKDYNTNVDSDLRQIKTVGKYPEDYVNQESDRNEEIYSQFRYHLKRSGITVESTKGEADKGQHEINVKYDEVLNMADCSAVIKMCIRDISDRNGKTACFMSKPFTNLLGSSSHLHINLLDKQGNNAFKGDDFSLSEKHKCSHTMVHFIGGCTSLASDFFVCFASNVNSYKRFVSYTYAPNKIEAWSFDNRTSPYRIVGEGKSIRIEYRIPAADINQYLSYSAMLAAVRL